MLIFYFFDLFFSIFQRNMQLFDRSGRNFKHGINHDVFRNRAQSPGA